jgi:lactoylglutathione lyase
MKALTRRAFVTAPLVFALAGVAVTAQLNPSATPAGRGQAAAQYTPVPDLPILGLAGVTFRSSDLEKSRGYYQGVLGFQEAFSLTDASGNVTSIFFKVNDDQYMEVIPGLKPGELRRIARITVQSSDLQKLHQIYTERGANPSPIRTGPDGNPVFRVAAPSDHNIDFIQYVPGSQQTLARGQFLSPDRVSTHIWHVGLMTTDREAIAPFYQGKLGLGRQLPGGRGESIDTPGGDSNTETKHPRLDRNNPAQAEQWIRENDGAANHMAIEITDVRKARDLAGQGRRHPALRATRSRRLQRSRGMGPDVPTARASTDGTGRPTSGASRTGPSSSSRRPSRLPDRSICCTRRPSPRTSSSSGK